MYMSWMDLGGGGVSGYLDYIPSFLLLSEPTAEC